MSSKQVRTHEPALPRCIVPEIGIVEPGFAGAGITLIASKFPFVRRTGFVPDVSKGKLAVRSCPGPRRVGLRPVGEVIWMMVRGCASGYRHKQL